MLWLLPAALAAPPAGALADCQTRERPDQCLAWLAATSAESTAPADLAAAETLNSAVYSLLAACSSRDGTGCALDSGEDGQAALIDRWCGADAPPGLPGSLRASLCLHLGELRERGLGEPRDEAAALQAFRVSCEADSYFGCLALIRNGDATGKAALAGRFREGCQGGSPADCEQLVAFTTDEAERLWAWERACEGDYPLACQAVSTQRFAEGDEAGGYALLKKACELGREDACLVLTEHQSREAAIADPAAACRSGDADACYRHGVALSDKAATMPGAIWEPAAVAFEVACGSRHQPACGELGRLLYHGKGLERDRDRAAKLLKRSCKADYWPACDGYAEMLRFGESMDEDPVAAAAVLERACAGDYADACWSLGWLRSDDPPVQDAEAAVDAWMKACTLGVVDGCEQVLERLGAGADASDAQTVLSAYAARGEAGAQDLKWFLLPALRTDSSAAWLAAACAGGDATACAVQSALAQ